MSERNVKTLADQVYGKLRAQIVSGQWPPDKRLIELEIAAEMGTSQGPVREALQRLEREGLVARQAHSATFVAPLLLDEMYELFSIRSLIEGFAARRTATCITEVECDELDRLLERMREAGAQDDMFMLTEHDLLFHRRICQWSGSASLVRAWDPLYSQIQRFVVATHKQYFSSVTAIAETHVPIVEALRARDVEHVTRIVQDHVMLIWALFEARAAAEGADGRISASAIPHQSRPDADSSDNSTIQEHIKESIHAGTDSGGR